MRVELPNGGWAELREPDTLTGEDEMIVRSALKLTAAPSEDGGDQAAEGQSFSATAGGTVAMEFAMIARVTTSWSLGQAITPENARALPLRASRPLRRAIKPHMEEMKEDKDPNPPAGS